MLSKYRDWIRERGLYDSEKAIGRCADVTAEMVKDFPELVRVRGWYVCPMTGERPHWWCMTADEEVVDPTVSQFPTAGQFAEYRMIAAGEPVPVGKCMECGGWCYDGSLLPFCCPDHEEAFRKAVEG